MYDDTNSISALRLSVCSVDRVLVAPAGRHVQAGAGERCLHSHPSDSPPERRAQSPGRESAPDRFAAEPSHGCGAAGSGVTDRWLFEMGDVLGPLLCPAVSRYARARDLVDRQCPVVFWNQNFFVVSVSSLLFVLDGSDPRVRFERDRQILAVPVCVRGANHVSGGWSSGDAEWNHVVYPEPGYRSCA